MKVKKRCCSICSQWFLPHPAAKNKNINRQKACSRKRCQKERHRQGCLEWHKKNPQADKRRRFKICAWAKKRDYWANWRKSHPLYRQREVKRMQRKRWQLKTVAKRDKLRQITLEKLHSVQALRPKTVAKRDELDPRIEGLLGFLFWKEDVAKRDELEVASLHG